MPDFRLQTADQIHNGISQHRIVRMTLNFFQLSASVLPKNDKIGTMILLATHM
jgi:hypothetical protein